MSNGVGGTLPLDRIRGIGDDGFKGFVVPMKWVSECIAVTDVEFIVIYIV